MKSYLTEELQVMTDIDYYCRTGKIRDRLIEFFDQNGAWRGDRRSWRGTFYKAAMLHMKHVHLDKYRRRKRTSSGVVLMTSYISSRTGNLNVPYVRVIGSLEVRSDAHISAASLQSVGRHLYATSGGRVYMPKLMRVGGDLDLLQGNLYAQNLELVEGNLHMQDFELPALKIVKGRLWMDRSYQINAPNLRYVGGDLIANMAESFHAPSLVRIDGDFELGVFTKWASVKKLSVIHGSFLAERTTLIDAPSLARVKGVLGTSMAIRYAGINPVFRVVSAIDSAPDEVMPICFLTWNNKLNLLRRNNRFLSSKTPCREF